MNLTRWKLMLVAVAVPILIAADVVYAADVVPAAIRQPGTQPQEIGNLETPDKCDNCHGGYNRAVEPAFNWRGSMMGNAGRDPIFWATMAIAEQDFDGSGDLCIRCHSTGGWYEGRSEPTDGSGLQASDDNGVDCDACHKMTNPDDSEYLGVMNPPFMANSVINGVLKGYYGSGILSLWGNSEKMGPYADPAARHQFLKSKFHRSVDFCGSCHDVSNPVVGDLAHNNGVQPTADPVISSGDLASPVDTKAAFNNLPHQYGVVERTFSEYKSGLMPETLVSSYPNLPIELQAGALAAGYESATAGGGDGNYADGTPRYYSCQTCHLRPVTGKGCNKKGAPTRVDLPLHDMTGGNYWMADAIIYQDNLGLLRLGGQLTTLQKDAMADGQVRAKKQLNQAASLLLTTNSLRVVNLTGHKLITGYPEGRRMWLNIKWHDGTGAIVREDGEYGDLIVDIDGSPMTVRTILDRDDPHTLIYEAHYGMTKEWAAQLMSLGYVASLPLEFDRVTGELTYTLGDLAGTPDGTEHETFHFALNNSVLSDNRIPPYGMRYDEARKRNALPVPAEQYGNPGPGGSYLHWDEILLNPPTNAVYSIIDLMYQPTSWEYIQFLYLANDQNNAFLGEEGLNMLDAWLNTGMCEPYVMVSTTWGQAPRPPVPDMWVSGLTTWSTTKKGVLVTPSNTFKPQDTVAIIAIVVDEEEAALSGAQVFMDVLDESQSVVTSLQEFTDENGEAILRWKIPRRQAAGTYTAKVPTVIKNGFEYQPGNGVESVIFVIQ